MDKTLGELLSDSRIKKIAPDAIRKRDLSAEMLWNKTLKEIREHFFRSDIARGLERLYAAADTGEWYYPLYSETECAENPDRNGVSLVWFPSGKKDAAEKPYILLVPGGGFVNVWNLTEGWPVAAQFNELGYHVFILTYQVNGGGGLLVKDIPCSGQPVYYLRFLSGRVPDLSLEHEEGIRQIRTAPSGGLFSCLSGHKPED